MTKTQEAELDGRIEVLAESIAEECSAVANRFRAGEVFGPDLPSDLDAGMMIFHGQVYGSSDGPSLGIIIAEDTIDEEEAREEVDWDLWEDLEEAVDLALCEAWAPGGAVYVEDNCVWWWRPVHAVKLISVTTEAPEPDDEDWYDEGQVSDVDFACVEPDEYDREEELTAVALAVDKLGDLGTTEGNSSSGACRWYSTPDAAVDYGTGESTIVTAHLQGFAEAEKEEVAALMRRR